MAAKRSTPSQGAKATKRTTSSKKSGKRTSPAEVEKTAGKSGKREMRDGPHITEVSITVRYCYGGRKARMDLDTTQMGGFIWDHDAMPDDRSEDRTPPPHKKKLHLNQQCDRDRNHAACCWWDPTSRTWICPDDVE